jgi:hypothetical protein
LKGGGVGDEFVGHVHLRVVHDALVSELLGWPESRDARATGRKNPTRP